MVLDPPLMVTDEMSYTIPGVRLHQARRKQRFARRLRRKHARWLQYVLL